MMMRILLFAMMTVLLASCNTPAMQAYQRGNADYAQGKYKSALTNYLYAANEHVPEAQYAVAYQYYYGIGITRDQSKAIVWLKRAAVNSVKARRALEQLKERDPQEPWLLKIHP